MESVMLHCHVFCSSPEQTSQTPAVFHVFSGYHLVDNPNFVSRYFPLSLSPTLNLKYCQTGELAKLSPPCLYTTALHACCYNRPVYPVTSTSSDLFHTHQISMDNASIGMTAQGAFSKMKGEMRGVQLVLLCSLTTRCNLILHTGWWKCLCQN